MGKLHGGTGGTRRISGLLAASLLLTAPALAGQDQEAGRSAGPGPCPRPASVPDAYARIAPSVVLIMVEGVEVDAGHEEVTHIRGMGSGFAIEPGLVITNYHVIEKATRVQVVLANGQAEPAILVGTAPQLDLALLRVPYDSDTLPPAELDSSRRLRVGEQVLAAGNPLGLQHSVSAGIVSGVDRQLPWLGSARGFIQFDAAVNPGQSGGPLVDECGRVIGVTTAKVLDAEAIGFAIPIATVERTVPDLVSMGHVFRPRIGFSGVAVNPDLAALFDLPADWGVLVEEVEEGSVAAKIGLRSGSRHMTVRGREFVLGGDIIVGCDEVQVLGPYELDDQLSQAHPGQKLKLSVIDPSGLRSLTLVVPEMRH